MTTIYTNKSINNHFIISSIINGVEHYLKFRNTENYFFIMTTKFQNADRWNDIDSVNYVLKNCRKEYRKHYKKSFTRLAFLKNAKIKEICVTQFTVITTK